MYSSPPPWGVEEIESLIPKYAQAVIHKIPDGPEWMAKAFELIVPHVCKQCNNTWLSDIETASKRHVLPLILGNTPDPLDESSMLQVAKWCYLKIISLELGRPSKHVRTHPDAVYAEFKRTGHPPYPNCSLAVGFVEVEGTSPAWVWFKSQGLKMVETPEGIPPLDGYLTKLVIGYFAIEATGAHDARADIQAEHAPGFQPLWPLLVRGGEFTWPPQERLRLKDNELTV